MHTRFIAAFTIVLALGTSALAEPAQEPMFPSIEAQRQILARHGYERWEWMRSNCLDCEIFILTAAPEMRTVKAQLFFQALMDKKAELQRLYGVNGAEYTLLAHMSIGILGRESKFWTSRRYRLKESTPWAIHLVKIMHAYLNGRSTASPSSRGPTQIKVIPAKIVQAYGVTPDTLHVPENAAVTTMGFLIEALGELKRRIVINRLSHINSSNYVDYLPYLYFGSTGRLISRTATPATNIYIEEMKSHMAKVEIYERRPVGGLRIN